MVAELTPGTREAGRAARRASASRPRRRCPTSTSTRSSPSLDADTRDYLQLLLGDGGEGLRGNGRPLARHAAALRADGARRCARSTSSSPPAAQNLPRVIHNFSLLVEELGGKDDQLADVRRHLERGVRLARRPGREPARHAARAARRAATRRRGARPSAEALADDARADARRACARRRARSGRRCARRARSSTRRRRSSATRSARSRARRTRRCATLRPAAARPRRDHARPHALAHGRQRAAQHARLQPAGRRRTRATCSGSRGPTTSRNTLFANAGRARPDPPRRRRLALPDAADPRERRRSATRSSASLDRSCSTRRRDDEVCPRSRGAADAEGAPSFARIAAMVVFALSCFGLLLFLWLAFGGPCRSSRRATASPPRSPRPPSSPTEADVRISGVPVGKVKSIEPDAHTGRSIVVHPARADATRRCRRTRARSCARRRCWGRPTWSSRRGRADARAGPGRRPAGRRRVSPTPSSSTRSCAPSTRRRAPPSRRGCRRRPRPSAAHGRDVNDALGNLGAVRRGRRRAGRHAQPPGGRAAPAWCQHRRRVRGADGARRPAARR